MGCQSAGTHVCFANGMASHPHAFQFMQARLVHAGAQPAKALSNRDGHVLRPVQSSKNMSVSAMSQMLQARTRIVPPCLQTNHRIAQDAFLGREDDARATLLSLWTVPGIAPSNASRPLLYTCRSLAFSRDGQCEQALKVHRHSSIGFTLV